MNKLLVVAVIALVAFAAFAALQPVEAFALELLVSMTEDYDLVFNPCFYVTMIPRASLLQGKTSLRTEQYAMFDIEQVYLNVNATALNVNGTLFFEAQFYFDTLAEQKLQLYRAYDPTNRTREITLRIDARLQVVRVNQTDIDKEFHGEWKLALL